MKKIQNYISTALASVEIDKCALTVLCNKHSMFSTLLDYTQNRFVFSGKHEYTNNDSFELSKHLKLLNEIFNVNKVRKLFVAINTTQNILLPHIQNKIVDENIIYDLLIGSLDIKTKLILKDKIKPLEIENIYALPTEIEDTLNTLPIENVSYSHYNTLILKLTELKCNELYAKSQNFARLFLSTDTLIILVYKNNTFKYLKTVEFVSIEDYVFQVLKVISSLEINFKDIIVFVNNLANISFKNNFIDILMLYFQNIEMENRPLAYSFDDEINETEISFLAPLYDLVLIE